MRRAAGLVVLALLLAALILNPAWFDWLFAPLTRNGAPAMYTHTSLLRLTLSHLAIVALSVSVSVLIAVPAAIWVTRGPFGARGLSISCGTGGDPSSAGQKRSGPGTKASILPNGPRAAISS